MHVHRRAGLSSTGTQRPSAAPEWTTVPTLCAGGPMPKPLGHALLKASQQSCVRREEGLPRVAAERYVFLHPGRLGWSQLMPNISCDAPQRAQHGTGRAELSTSDLRP